VELIFAFVTAICTDDFVVKKFSLHFIISQSSQLHLIIVNIMNIDKQMIGFFNPLLYFCFVCCFSLPEIVYKNKRIDALIFLNPSN
jgi:hypothetical protein